MKLRYINIPISILCEAARINLEVALRFFVVLKMLFPEGKATEKEINREFWRFGYSDRRSCLRMLAKVQQLGWVRFNPSNSYFLLYSFRRIQQNIKEIKAFRGMHVRLEFKDLFEFKSFIGGAIYSGLWKTYMEKECRIRGGVPRFGGTYHSLEYLHLTKWAPCSAYGVEKLIGISKSKADRLKNAAIKKSYLKRRHQYQRLDSRENRYHNEVDPRLLIGPKKDTLRMIDLILPQIHVFYQKKTNQ